MIQDDRYGPGSGDGPVLRDRGFATLSASQHSRKEVIAVDFAQRCQIEVIRMEQEERMREAERFRRAEIARSARSAKSAAQDERRFFIFRFFSPRPSEA